MQHLHNRRWSTLWDTIVQDLTFGELGSSGILTKVTPGKLYIEALIWVFRCITAGKIIGGGL